MDRRGRPAVRGVFLGVPWPLAFALQADGGYLRQDILAKIVLPWNGRSPFNAVETADGEIVPLSGSEGEDVWIYLPSQSARKGGEIDE